MELTEAFERVVLRHWVVILLCLMVTGTAATAYELTQAPTYQASVRLLLDASDPTSQTAAQALADTAKGLATAPTTVSAALQSLGVVRDPVQVAANISVVPLGSSGVLLLSVNDESATVARGLANSLAKAVVHTRQQIGSSGVDAVISQLDGQIADYAGQISQLSSQIDTLTAQLRTKSDPSSVASLDSKISSLVSNRNDLTAQRDALTNEEGTLRANDALRPQASIVDLAGPAVRSNSFTLPSAIGLAIVLGLLIGVTVSGVEETFWPTVGGRAALAREAGAPYLGSLPAPPWNDDAARVRTATSRLRLAASAAGVDRVELIGADPSVDLGALVREMHAALGERGHSGPQISVIDSSEELPSFSSRAKQTRRSKALVLVTPAVVRRSAFQAVTDYRSLSGMDMLGVIAYSRYRWASDTDRSKPEATIERVEGNEPLAPGAEGPGAPSDEKAVNS